jgi:hypothetical protein
VSGVKGKGWYERTFYFITFMGGVPGSPFCHPSPSIVIIPAMNKAHRTDIITIIVIALLTFGSQIPSLGFFQDDWNFVFYFLRRGAPGLFEFLLVDGRPGAVWVYDLGFHLLGYHPAAWQAFTLLLRVLTTLVFWMILKRLWPERRYGNLVAAIFFLAYPFFTLQPLAVTYSQHFLSYLLYALSIYFMIQAVLKPERYLLYTIPAVLFAFVHLFTNEYFVGLELLRPLVLWFLLARPESLPWRQRLKKVLLAWLPYLLVLLFFVLWRSLFLPALGARNNPLAVLSEPGAGPLAVLRNFMADGVLMLVTSWFNIINPRLFVLGPIRNFYYLVFVLVGSVSFYLLARAASREVGPEKERRQVLLGGALMAAAGMIAAYSVGYILNLKLAPWNSRFALPAMLGLALLVSATIELLISSPRARHIFFAVLVGFLIGWHNYNTLEYKSAWEKQSRLYEQLIWRAPSLKPGTAIVTNEEILGYMGDYPTSYGINSIYASDSGRNVPYWFFAQSENFHTAPNPDTGETELEAQRGTVTFRGKPDDALYISYEPENKQCLWVLRPQDAEYKYLPDTLKKGAVHSNLQNILPQEGASDLYRTIVSENRDTWCYYYQKADLARQMQAPQQVISLWQDAQKKGLRPDNGFEYIPFIEAYARLGQWDQAYQLTRTSNRMTQAMYFILCPTWKELAQDTPDSPSKAGFLKKTYDALECVAE